jgi:hypothetical protein
MKKFLFTLGLSSSIAFSMGFVMKVLHWPGANIALYGGVALFCYLFAPLWVFRLMSTQQLGAGSKLGWIVGVISGATFATGSIFKVLHYPGAGILTVVGMVLFSFVFLPFIFYRIYKPNNLFA